MRRSVIAAVAAAAVLVVAAGALLRFQRGREWAHGGDRLTVDVEVAVAVAGRDSFEAVVVRLGVPPGKATRLHSADQSVVVRVRWSGAPHTTGSFELIALDGRVTPPRPLAADGGWNSDGATGSDWASAYEVLAEHYNWLRGTAQANYTDANGMTRLPTASVSAPASATGTVTAWFRQWGEGPIPFADANRNVVVALVYVDDSGEVRWARRISG